MPFYNREEDKRRMKAVLSGEPGSKMAKLALGTAQFGMNYGINNLRGKVPEQEVSEILQLASLNGIDLLDTAHLYGESERVIGLCISKKKLTFHIVSKLPSVKNFNEAENYLSQSLKRLGVKNLYGYLIHNFENFRENLWLWEFLGSLKLKGLVKKIGFSLYFPEELEFLLDRGFIPDLLQVPFSIFDQRFGLWFPRLKKLGVEIHARSVFLQGLIFKIPESLPSFFSPIAQNLKKIREFSEKEGIPLEGFFLNFVIDTPEVDFVIVGVDGQAHFKGLLKALSFREQVFTMREELSSLRVHQEDLLIPYRWPKNFTM